jgi:hypothetical protein
MNPIRLTPSEVAHLFGDKPPGGAKKRRAKGKRDAAKLTRAIAWGTDLDRANRGPLVVFVAARLKNPLNGSYSLAHWQVRAKPANAARASAKDKCRLNRVRVAFPVVVKMTRLGAGTMDEGCGLNASLKPIRDGVADYFGAKDNDPGYSWQYAQDKAPAGCFGCLIEFSYPDGAK